MACRSEAHRLAMIEETILRQKAFLLTDLSDERRKSAQENLATLLERQSALVGTLGRTRLP